MNTKVNDTYKTLTQKVDLRGKYVRSTLLCCTAHDVQPIGVIMESSHAVVHTQNSGGQEHAYENFHPANGNIQTAVETY
jgi:hypothetical protein